MQLSCFPDGDSNSGPFDFEPSALTIIPLRLVKLYFYFCRLFGNQILCVGNEIGRLPPQFGDASKITNAILVIFFQRSATP